MASGYECITGKDARFLNSYRSFFGSRKEDFQKVQPLQLEDFYIGGILNPSGEFIAASNRYMNCLKEIKSFPFLNKLEIHKYFYRGNLEDILYRMELELFRDIDGYLLQVQRPVSFLKSNTAVIRLLQKSSVHAKIAALHMCGLGEKLKNAFEIIFADYEVFIERSQIHPTA